MEKEIKFEMRDDIMNGGNGAEGGRGEETASTLALARATETC